MTDPNAFRKLERDHTLDDIHKISIESVCLFWSRQFLRVNYDFCKIQYGGKAR